MYNWISLILRYWGLQQVLIFQKCKKENKEGMQFLFPEIYGQICKFQNPSWSLFPLYLFLCLLTTMLWFFLPSQTNQSRQNFFGLHLIDTDILLDKSFSFSFVSIIWIIYNIYHISITIQRNWSTKIILPCLSIHDSLDNSETMNKHGEVIY